MTNKTAFLLCCSALAACSIGTAARAQQVAQDAATNPPDVEPATTVPANSDAAEQEKVRDRVEERAGEQATVADPATAAELARIKAIRTLREKDGATAAKAPEDGTITVTGSRLRDGDQTSRLTVIDGQEIQARGVTSVEELIRTLPQNVATIGAITNNRSRGPLRGGSRNAPLVSSVGALGVSAANLGGVGAGNTLVLVNGRRIAGAAGIEQGYANLNGIPVSAIERVEISNGGGAAIYGADALGGVINFILKSNYVGTTLSAQHEFSSGGADNSRVSLYTGRAWNSGNLAVTLDYARREPINNRKTGYTTNNYAPFFGDNPIYDRRTFSNGAQPGVIVRPAVYDPDTGELIRPETALTVPTGFTGAPTEADLIEVDLSRARDYVPTSDGPRTRTLSATLAFEQNLTSRLRVFVNGLYSRARNAQESSAFRGIFLQLGPGQFYNPFPAFGVSSFVPATEVYYYPAAEIADGSLPVGDVTNVATSWNVNAGASYDLNRDTKVEVVYTRSRSTTKGRSKDLGSIVSSFIEDANSPTGFSCYNDLLANDLIAPGDRAAYQASFDRQCAALSSADPTVAFNPFKSTSNGGGSGIDQFLYLPPTDRLNSRLSTIEGRLTGVALTLPGGRVNYALGAEYARSAADSQQIRSVTGEQSDSDRQAFFGEVTIPIAGRDFTLPGVRRLLVNVAVRRDVTSAVGAIGTVDSIPIDQGGKIIYAKNRFARTTPAFGVLWSPTDTLDLRAKFTRGFKAPPSTELFTTLGSFVSQTLIFDDPLYTCTTDCDPGSDGRYYTVPSRTAPNPDLKPETSKQMILSASWQPTGFLSGASLAVTYNRNRIRNQFATLRDLYRFLPAAEVLKLGQFFPRDANGKVIAQLNQRFNVIGSNYESLTVEASYLFDTGIGSFQPKFTYVNNLVAENIGFRRDFVVSQRGRILGVDKYRWVGSLEWNKGPLTASLFVYHIPDYLNDYQSTYTAGQLGSPELITRVASLTTTDLTVAWVASRNLRVQFAGRNILKARAPFTVVDSLPYDTSRYNVAGRTLALSAQLSF